MKFLLPNRGKYRLSEPFWLDVGSRYDDKYIIVKAICFGWNCTKTLQEMVTPTGELFKQDAKIEIPYGTVISLGSYTLTPYKDIMKFSVNNKDNKHLAVKVDYETVLKTVIANPDPREIDWTIRHLQSVRMNWESSHDILNNIECEEYTP